MSLLTMSSPDSSTADGSLNSSSNTPGSSSKRRAKLIGDLEAGAKLVESLDKSDDVYSRFLEETSSEPSTDGGDIARLSSGGEAGFSRIASSDSQAQAQKRGRTFLAQKLSVRVTDDSSTHLAVVKSLQHSPEPPVGAPQPHPAGANNPRVAMQARKSWSESANKKEETTGSGGRAVQAVSRGDKNAAQQDSFARPDCVSSEVEGNGETPKDSFKKATSPQRRVTLSRGNSREGPRLNKSPIARSPLRGDKKSPLVSLKAESPLDSPARHARARVQASSFAVRSLKECPFFEGMLKVECFGEQRVKQLLYDQATWLPAYCVLKDGVVTCSKDKRHTQVVDSFDMSETRVLKSDRGPKFLNFWVTSGTGGAAVVEFMAKTDKEVETWIKLCGIAKKWAENNRREKMGIMPLSDAANKIVGVRRMVKRWHMRLVALAYDKWCEHLEEKHAKTVLPDVFQRACSVGSSVRPLSRPSSNVGGRHDVPRSSTPENKTRTSAAFMPGQARAIRVVNGRVEVQKAMKKNDLAKKIADEKRRAEEAAAAKGAEAASAVSFHRVPSHTANRRANLHAEEEGEEPKQRSLDDMAHDVVDMMDRFDRVHKGMCAQLSKAGI